MIIIIDLDLQQAVQGFGSKQVAPTIQVKSQDTPTLSIYFAKGNVNYDLGTSPGLRFGLFVAGNPNPLVQYSTFTRVLDAQSRVTYVGYPNFNTTAMAAAIGSQPQLACLGEIRYQTSFGTIARTADIDFTVTQPHLTETVMDSLIAAFVTPAVNANATARINSTSWLSVGLNISIGAGAGAYQVVSITNLTDFIAKNLGAAGNAASGTTIPIGTSVGIAPVNVLAAYPDPSIIEITTHKNQPNGYPGLDGSGHVPVSALPTTGGFELQANKDAASGYAGLDATTKLKAAEFPIDNTTLTFVAGLLGVAIDNHTLQIVSGKLVALPGSGDMTKAVYDTNNDGIVDHAALADTATSATSANSALSAASATKIAGTGAGVWTQDGSGNQSWQPSVSNLTDAETSIGVSVISNAAGVLRRLVAGSNVTLTADSPTVGGITIAAAAGGGGVASLTDATTASGTSIIHNASGVLQRLIATDSSIAMVSNPNTVGIATALADAETTTGATLLGSTNGQIKRLIAGTNVTLDSATTPGGVIVNATAGGGVASLTDAETSAGASIISSSSGVLKRLVAGTNITLTPDSPTVGGVTIAATGGSAGLITPSTGIEQIDDFVSNTTAGKLGWALTQDSGSGASIAVQPMGVPGDNEVGIFLMSSQSTGTTGQARYTLGSTSAGPISAGGRGVLTIEWRVKITAINTTAAYAEWRAGLMGGNPVTTWSGAYFQYNANTSANWQAITGNGSALNTQDTGVAVTTNYVRLKIITDAAWATITFQVNDTTVATSTTQLPVSSTGWSPVVTTGLRAGTTVRQMALDYYYFKYLLTR
jgi:hypothetical protein